MHRTLEITVKVGAGDALARELVAMEDVVGLSVSEGASRKPPGDVLTGHVLNRGADEVLQAVARVHEKGPISVVTSETASIIDPDAEQLIERDVDEALWEEMKSGLRQQGRTTQNFLILMGLGGALSAVGLVSDPAPQAIAFVAAACIAPGFEPFTGIAVGVFFRSRHLVGRACRSVLAGYAMVTLVSALTFWAMCKFGVTSAAELVANPMVKAIAHPGPKEIVVSVCGALSGVVILSAYRRSVIVGALIALVTISAASLVGCALVVGRFDLAGRALTRVGEDAALIIVLGILVFWYKQSLVHHRKPLV